MSANLGHCVGVIHDHRTARQLPTAYMLYTASSQLHPPTVLHAIASLSASLWLLLPELDLVLPKCAMVFWSANSHRFLRPVERDPKRDANSSPSCRRGSERSLFPFVVYGAALLRWSPGKSQRGFWNKHSSIRGWMLCRNWLFGSHHTTSCKT